MTINRGQKFDAPRIRSHLVESSERQRDLDLDAAEKATPSIERQRLREIADVAHKGRLIRINDVVSRFIDLDGRADTTEVSRQLARILAEEGVDAALAYADAQKPGLLSEIDAQLAADRDRLRIKLAPLLSAANLHASSGKTAAARAVYHDILQRDPDWASALESFAWYLFDQSNLSNRHGSLLSALSDAEEAQALSTRLYAINPTNPKTLRLFSATLEQIGIVLVKRGQHGDSDKALGHFTRCLEVREMLLQANPNSAEPARDVSVVLRQMGEFLAKRGQPGDGAKALDYFNRCLHVCEALLQANPNSAEASRDVSVIMEWLGGFLATRGQPGDLDKAFGYFSRSLALRQTLLQANPKSGEASRDVSVIMERFGGFLATRGQPGDPDKACDYLTRCLGLREALLQENPNSAEASRDVSIILDELGRFIAARGQPGDSDKALGYFNRSFQLSETLLQANPTSAEASRDVSFRLERLGDFLSTRGQPGDSDKALDYFTRSLALRETLLQANPNSAVASRDVSIGMIKLGGFLAMRGYPGDADRALDHFTCSLRLSEALLQANSNSAQASRDVSTGMERLGDFLAIRGQPGDSDKALGCFTRSLHLSETVYQANPNSAQAARDVSVSLNKLGSFLAKSGQPNDVDKAHDYLTRCLEVRETLLQSNPNSAEASRDLSVGLNQMGSFLVKRGQSGDAGLAHSYFTRSLRVSEMLLQANPNSAQAARDVSVSLNKLGSFLATRGQPGDADKALDYFTRYQEICETLLKATPGSAQAMRDVSVGLEMLGDTLVKRGQPGDSDKALVYLTRCLSVRETLLQSTPSSAQAMRDVSVSLGQLGSLLMTRAQPGDSDKALGYFTRCLNVCDSIFQATPGSAQATRDVLASHYLIAQFAKKYGDASSEEQHLRAIYYILKPSIERGIIFDSRTKQSYENLKRRFPEVIREDSSL